MNKYQEALIKLVTHNYSTRSEKNEYINILQELIDEKTPMKPIKEIIDDSYDDNDRSIGFQWERIKCPNCKEDLVSEPEFRDFVDYPYCPLCSQKLDWSDTDE